jgi:hypothetical protein
LPDKTVDISDKSIDSYQYLDSSKTDFGGESDFGEVERV